MSNLETLPNIGKTLAKKLELVGINTPEDLKQAGAENAFIKIKTIDETACAHMLYALEGAIQDVRWHHLPNNRKLELLDFFHNCKEPKP